MEIEYRDKEAIIETHTYGPAKAYVARITGTHPKYRLEREFCYKRDVTHSRSNVYRDLEFAVRLEEGAVYQYRGMDASSGKSTDGFWRVEEGGLHEIGYAEAVEAAETLVQA
jgi:hypothetical protein